MSTCEYQKEVRFAVVMYGGISLAIYMNGVARELLNLVRATAPDDRWLKNHCKAMVDDGDLVGSESVYRDLTRYIVDAPEGTIPVRFLVDIISGTSAGGLNGIFLAKALANELPITPLQDLWVNEGEILKLINDGESYDDLTGLDNRHPESLLNSDRMYAKILTAFSQMENAKVVVPKDKAPADGGDEVAETIDPNLISRLVDALDLHVTATDLRGLNTPIYLKKEDTPPDPGPEQVQRNELEPLLAQAILERRYRTVFQFRYADWLTREGQAGSPWNDFSPENTPFIAFCGRCTSSIVPAFEPMRLIDAKRVLDSRTNPNRDLYKYDPTRWNRFFRDYWTSAHFYSPDLPADQAVKESTRDFESRQFGDGGYLDNKPFTHATATLSHRRADVEVDRKLIYVEPHPTDPNAIEVAAERVADKPKLDFVDHIFAATGLPSKEPIRDDIAALRNRSKLLQRIARMRTKGIAEGGGTIHPSDPREAAYRQVRVASTLDALTDSLRRILGMEDESPYIPALRVLLDVWREKFEEDEEAFLRRFDAGYLLRRHVYVRRGLSRATISEADPDDKVRYRLAQKRLNHLFFERLAARPYLRDVREAILRLSGMAGNDAVPVVTREDEKARVDAIAGGLLKLKIRSIELGYILGGSEETERRRRAEEILGVLKDEANPIRKERPKILDEVTNLIADHFGLIEVDREFEAWKPDLEEISVQVEKLKRQFHVDDRIEFPITYAAGATESREVDVIRVSPLEADSLFKDRSERVSKLMGVGLGHFAAFFHETGRRHDILWGRLDAAERLICVLLPSSVEAAVRQGLIARAQMAILMESLPLLQAVDAQGEGRPFAAWLASKIRKSCPLLPEPVLLRDVADPTLARELIRTGRSAPRPLPTRISTETQVRAVGRSAPVLGRLLDDAAARQTTLKSVTRWTVRIAAVVWAAVEVVLPTSWVGIVGRRWAGLILLLGFFMVGIGILGGASAAAVLTWGWRIVFLAGGFLIIVIAVRCLIWRGTQKRPPAAERLALPILVILAAIACLVGHATLVNHVSGMDPRAAWPRMQSLQLVAGAAWVAALCAALAEACYVFEGSARQKRTKAGFIKARGFFEGSIVLAGVSLIAASIVGLWQEVTRKPTFEQPYATWLQGLLNGAEAGWKTVSGDVAWILVSLLILVAASLRSWRLMKNG